MNEVRESVTERFGWGDLLFDTPPPQSAGWSVLGEEEAAPFCVDPHICLLPDPVPAVKPVVQK